MQAKIPRCFKHSNIVIIPKCIDKDPKLVKSYRPICLLNTLGKIQERLLCKRWREHRYSIGVNRWQFGFRAGSSAEDAINHVIDAVSQSGSTYVVGILIDIAGAFDNLWWPSLFRQLRELNCPGKLYLSFLDYCRDRVVGLEGNSSSIYRSISKGAPQGSVLGPEFWDLHLDPLLDLLMARPQEVMSATAYADDLVVLVEANSRLGLEVKCRNLLGKIHSWFGNRKLTIAPSKICYILLKGRLNRGPSISLVGNRIKRDTDTRYLGEQIDEKLNFYRHMDIVCKKAEKVIHQLANIGQRQFHVPLRLIRRYHDTILVSIVAYGASSWAHRLRLGVHRKRLRKTQRSILLRFSGAYSTISTLALLALLGIWPLDLKVRLMGANYWLKKGNLHRAQEIVGRHVGCKRETREALLHEWQQEWSEADVGGRARNFFPDLGERLNATHLDPSRGLIHFLSGHGPYATYLERIRKRANDLCDHCGVPGTPEHMVLECPYILQDMGTLRRSILSHDLTNIITDSTLFWDLNLVSEIYSKKKLDEFRAGNETSPNVVVPDVVRPPPLLRRSNRNLGNSSIQPSSSTSSNSQHSQLSQLPTLNENLENPGAPDSAPASQDDNIPDLGKRRQLWGTDGRVEAADR